MISSVKKCINVPLIVGGGVRDAEAARAVVEAGADVLVTGTVIEKDQQRLKDIIAAVHSFRRKKWF